MRTTQTSAVADRLAIAEDRLTDGADLPWAGLFAAQADGGEFFGVCGRLDLGPAVLLDMAGARLRLRDDDAAITSGLIFLQCVVEGEFVLGAGDAGETRLHAGQVVIRPASAQSTLVAETPAHIVTLAMPTFLLTPRFAGAGALPLAGAIAHGSLAARLLCELLTGLAHGGRDKAGRHAAILDAAAALAGLCLAERPPAPVTLTGLAAARADEIIRYLERNFANTQLNPGSMADELGISVRYAHKLLEQTGRSFRQELIGLRLRAARRAFAAGSSPRQTIADIAISVGFNDLSQFNRHFRQAYAMTPRAARQRDEVSAARDQVQTDARGSRRSPALSP